MDSRRQSLQFIAEGVIELAGFGVAAISVVRDGVLETAAVAGDPSAVAELMESRTPVEAVMRELQDGEDWGCMRFVPHDRSSGALDPFCWTPSTTQGSAPDAWHPEDLLIGLLHDGAGTLRGILSVDVPTDGRRPSLEQRRILDLYARQAERAVVAVLEREEFAIGMARERATADHRSHLINVLSHELQNPVSAILGHVELLLEHETSDEAIESVHFINTAATRIDTMVQDLLRLARLGEAPASTYEVSDLVEVARSVADALDPLARAGRIALDLEIGAARLPVAAAAADTRSIIENLVSNALKYSNEGGRVRVVLTTSHDTDGGAGWVQLVVQDDGIGIDAHEQERVMEEFFRSSTPDAQRRRGTGLGLAIVHRIVERQGGRLELWSRVGVGTRFTVLLPRALDDRALDHGAMLAG